MNAIESTLKEGAPAKVTTRVAGAPLSNIPNPDSALVPDCAKNQLGKVVSRVMPSSVYGNGYWVLLTSESNVIVLACADCAKAKPIIRDVLAAQCFLVMIYLLRMLMLEMFLLLSLIYLNADALNVDSDRAVQHSPA